MSEAELVYSIFITIPAALSVQLESLQNPMQFHWKSTGRVHIPHIPFTIA